MNIPVNQDLFVDYYYYYYYILCEAFMFDRQQNVMIICIDVWMLYDSLSYKM